jgi:23S rRNA (guanosine2251-2'-O)-methyltransferase
MLLYGVRPVLEALASPEASVRRIIVARGIRNPRIQTIVDDARRKGVPVSFEPSEALTRRAGVNTHQSVVAEISAVPLTDLEAMLERSPSRILLLDGVVDPRNLGAVLRTAEAAGVAHILLTRHQSCGITPTVVKASAGAAMHLRVATIGNVARNLLRLKDAGYWAVGLDMEGDLGPQQIDPALKLVLIVGGEDRGLRRLVREKCDFLVRLPMRGRVNSLNLSVAAGILLYALADPEMPGRPAENR